MPRLKGLDVALNSGLWVASGDRELRPVGCIATAPGAPVEGWVEYARPDGGAPKGPQELKKAA